ncbi:MAG: aldose epimerase family protein [Pseudorhodobacter sp.]
MIRDFGTSSDGHEVREVTLEGRGLRVKLLTLGAALRSLRLEGVGHDLTQGIGQIGDIDNGMGFHGVIVGPVANRINGGQAKVAGKICRFDTDREPGVTLHSGATGLHRQNWEIVEASEQSVLFRVDLPDGLGGFPGNRHVSACYTLSGPKTLRLDLTMITDAPTLANLAHHGYWTLDGRHDLTGHRLRIAASGITETDERLIPTGRILSVTDTAYDFRKMRLIDPGQPPLDTNFCLATARRTMRDVLWLEGAGGVTMVLATTEPGLQIYDQRPGYAALAIEPQFWPDAPNHPGFPPILLQPGQDWRQSTEWRFDVPAL